jgi:excisionase family DNA binding protein
MKSEQAREPTVYGIPEASMLTSVQVTDDSGEKRAFFLTTNRLSSERSGVAVAADSDLMKWLQLDRTRMPLRKHIRICLEKQLLGYVEVVWQMSGDGLRKPVENFAISANQLQLVLHFSARQIDQALLLAVLRGYDQAEGRPPRQKVQPPIAQTLPPAPAVVLPAQKKQEPDFITLGTRVYPPDDPMGFRANFDPEYKAKLQAEAAAARGALPEAVEGEVIADGIELVPFVGGTLSAMRQNDRGWLVLKPACEALGIDFSAQRKKLQEAAWATVAMTATVGADGKQREMYCLRSDRVAMWLATIDTTRITDPEARQRLEVWQCEAAEALDKWWRGKQNIVAEQPRMVAMTEEDFARIVRKILQPEEAAPEPIQASASPTENKTTEPMKWFGPKEVAKTLGVGVQRVYRWINDKSLAHYRVGAKDIRISSEQLDDFVASHLRQH